MQSYIFDFKKSPSFMRKWNKEFDVEDIGTNCFNIVLVDDVCDDNIEDVLNLDGQIKYNESHLIIAECGLNYVIDDDSHEHIILNGEVEIDFADLDIDDFNMKGCFITNDGGYVMGYSINTFSLNISNGIIFENGLYLWSIIEGEVNG